jgi:hypothetical protein
MVTGHFTRYSERKRAHACGDSCVPWKTLGLGDLVRMKGGLFYVLSVLPNSVEPTDKYFVRLCGPITQENIGACRTFVSGSIMPSTEELNGILCWQNITSETVEYDSFWLEDPSLLRFTTIFLEPGTPMIIDDVSEDPGDYLNILQWYGGGFSGAVYHVTSSVSCCYPETTQDIIQQLPDVLMLDPSRSTSASFSDVRPGDFLLHQGFRYFVFDTYVRRIGCRTSVGFVLYGAIEPGTSDSFRLSRLERRVVRPLSFYHLEEYNQRIIPCMMDTTFSALPNITGRSVHLVNGSIGIGRPDVFDRLWYLNNVI